MTLQSSGAIIYSGRNATSQQAHIALIETVEKIDALEARVAALES